MRIAHLSTLYADYAKKFDSAWFQARLGPSATYQQMATCFFEDRFSWSDAWGVEFQRLGYESLVLVADLPVLHQKWCEEQNLPYRGVRQTCIEMLKKFKPEVLWYDDISAEYLAEIQAQVPDIQIVIGLCGSAIAKSKVWKMCDFVISCAPESVEYFNSQGIKAFHMHHPFDARIAKQIAGTTGRATAPPGFIGQLLRTTEFHRQREEFILKLTENLDVNIFSSSASITFLQELFNVAKCIVRGRPYRAMVNPKLRRYLKPAQFGLDMYRAIYQSECTLNIHADSSPRFVSNMRLFETTGAGGLLLTDHRPNLGELFVENEEVLSFKNVEDAVRQLRWIQQHPAEAEQIRINGQKRALRDHTVEKRSPIFMEVLSGFFKGTR